MTVYQPLHLCSINIHIPQRDPEMFSSDVAPSVISKMADFWYRSIQKQFTSPFWCWLLKREKFCKIWTVVVCLFRFAFDYFFFWLWIKLQFSLEIKLRTTSVRTFSSEIFRFTVTWNIIFNKNHAFMKHLISE